MVRELHPVAAIFPEMAEHEYAGLLESVRRHGLLHPILLHPDGRILDGRHRDRACREAGIEPQCMTYDGPLDDESLARRVWDENAERRHLKKQHLNLAAARIANLQRGSAPGTEGNGIVTNSNSVSSNELTPPSPVSLEKAAKITGTTHAGAKRAKDVINAREDGHAGLESHLERGHLSTSAAAELARSGQEDLLTRLDEDDSKEAAEAAARELRERRAEARRLEKERLDEQVPKPDREAYREEMAKKPSERNQSRTIVPLPNTTDEDERDISEMEHQNVITRLLSVISNASATLKLIIDEELKTELLTDGNRDVIAEHIRMIRVHLDYLTVLGDNVDFDNKAHGLQ
jgi:ParB/Sulfiredoxin domain